MNATSNHQQNVAWRAALLMLATLAGAGACSTGASLGHARPTAPTPSPSDRSFDPVAADFKKLLRTYITAAGGRQDVLIEIEPVENAALKDLPADLGQLLRNAVEQISGPLRTVRAWVELPNRPEFVRSRGEGRTADYRLTGKLIEAVESVVLGGDLEAAGMVRRPPADGGVKKGTRVAVKTIRIALTLEDPAGEAVPGATVTYQVDIQKVERSRSFSVYIAGNGFSWGKDRVDSQDPAAAVQDALNMAVTHLLGNGLLVPYWRVSATIGRDERLIERFQSSLQRMTQPELEHLVKRYLDFSAWPMDLTVPTFTVADKAVVIAAMRQRAIDPAAPNALIALASNLWSTLDFRSAAAQVERRLDDAVRKARTAAAQASAPAAQPAEWHLSPREFDWHSSTSMVVVDMARVTDPSLRRRIAQVVQRAGGAEVRIHPVNPLLGVRNVRNPAHIQAALRQNGLPLEYRWLTDSNGQEYLVLRSMP